MRRQGPKPAVILRRRLLRQLAIWLGLACVFAQLSAAAHDVLVDHVRCAEHGEWVHASHRHAISWTDARAHADSDGMKTVTARHEAEFAEAHEHCLLWSDRHAAALVASARLEVTELGIARATALAEPSRKASSGDVYSFAPKTSPPVSNRSS